MSSAPIELTVNGDRRTLEVSPDRLLLDVLREDLTCHGPKEGCDTAKCGACTVLLDGDPVKSCNLLAYQADGRSVTTVEGLGDEGLTPVQEAFWDEFAFQCGYCTPGMIMSATALLDETDDPKPAEIRTALKGNICRCTGYIDIIRGVEAAATRRQQE